MTLRSSLIKRKASTTLVKIPATMTKKIKKYFLRKKSAPTGTKPHPPVATMVYEAVENLKERRGSSLQAIKKHMAATHLVDVRKLASYIRRALKKAVDTHQLVQTKGVGANGMFKLAADNAGMGPKKSKQKKTTAAGGVTRPNKPRKMKKGAKTK